MNVEHGFNIALKKRVLNTHLSVSRRSAFDRGGRAET